MGPELDFELDPATAAAPKYERIVNGVTDAIQRKVLPRGAALPSISLVSERFSVSRETVAKAYRVLKRRGIIQSVPSKGYYVATESIRRHHRVFLMLSAFNQDNRLLYSAFEEAMGDEGSIDVFFHNYNIQTFAQSIAEHLGEYGVFVIKPFNHRGVVRAVGQIADEKVMLLARRDYLPARYTYIGQDFDRAVYDCLATGLTRLRKYAGLNLLDGRTAFHPVEVNRAVKRFCADHDIAYGALPAITRENIRRGQAYITTSDDDLVLLLEVCEENGWTVGKDIGVLSYYDTPLKKFLAGGISVMTSDFKAMGVEAARQIRERNAETVRIPTRMVLRNSL